MEASGLSVFRKLDLNLATRALIAPLYVTNQCLKKRESKEFEHHRLSEGPMQKSMSAIVIFILAVCSLPAAAGPEPRKAPELSFYDRSGKAISLSKFKGKVVVLEFLFVRSMHCARVAQTLNKLNNDLSSRGVQSLGVAFSAPQSEADAVTVDNFIQSLGLAYPVGYTNKEDIDKFLERGKYDVLSIPQVIIIDRAGVIRAQSGARPGDPKLEDENALRTLLETLLKENAPKEVAARSAKAVSKR